MRRSVVYLATVAWTASIALTAAVVHAVSSRPGPGTAASEPEAPGVLSGREAAGILDAVAAVRREVTGVRRDVAAMKDDLAADRTERSEVAAARKESPPEAPHDDAGDARAARTLEETTAAPSPPRLDLLAPLTKWFDDVDVRRRWLLVTQREAIKTFGVPNEVNSLGHPDESWIYHRDFVDEEGDDGVEKIELRFAYARLIWVRSSTGPRR